MRLKLVPSETTIDFLRLRIPALGFSGILVAASLALFTLVGLNLGIDFRGGILIEARNTTGVADIGVIRSDLNRLGLGDISIQGFGSETDVLVRVQRQEGDESAQIAAIKAITGALGTDYDIRRTEFVGPTVGAELAEKGILAVICPLPKICDWIVGAETTFPSSTMAKGRPILAPVTRPNRFAPVAFSVKLTAGLLFWSKLACAVSSSSPLTMTRFSTT